ncbi:MAG TPA: hypothetical protein VH540_11650 [Ktedonobacterales bacterium]
MSTRQTLWRTLAVVFVALLVSGCAPQRAAGEPAAVQTVEISDDFAPTVVSLQDTSPGQLALSLYLQLGGYEAEDRDIAELNVSFTSQGGLVQFTAGESVSCNGMTLPGYGTNFNLKVPSEVFSGKLVTCVYTSGKTSATFSFTAPLAPVILSPKENARVPHSKRTPVTYRISQDREFYVIAIGPTTGGMTKAWTPTATRQPNPVLLDTSAFQPGAGSIAMNQLFPLSDLRGPDFQSVQGNGGAEYEIQVTWA